MIVRLGYVSIAKQLGKKVTSSSSVTFANYSKIVGDDNKLNKLISVTASNVNDLQAILKYNIENNIHFYRMTSNLIPLDTHPDVPYWGYTEMFKKDFEYIGKLIKESNMRVDTHPSEYNVINSIKPEVVRNSEKVFLTHIQWFEDMDYPLAKMVVHVGGATGGKEEGIKRFLENFSTFPEKIKSRLIVENDDKTYTSKETLEICEALNVPMVLDVHHHNCNRNDCDDVFEIMPRIFATWDKELLPPKLHFSSPREKEGDRKHSDYIYADDFVDFIDKVKIFNTDIDIMLECKEKDIALFQLVDDIKLLRPNYKWIDETTFEV